MKNIILLLTITMLIFSCNTIAKQQRKAETFYLQHPEKLASKCAETFPLKDSLGKTDTVFSKADNIDYSVTIDSLKSLVDSLSTSFIVITDSNCIEQYNLLLKKNSQLKNSIAALQQAYKPCRPDTLRLHDTIYRQSTGLLAANAYLIYQRDSSKNALIKTAVQLDDAKKSASTRFWWIIGLIVALALSIYLIIKK